MSEHFLNKAAGYRKKNFYRTPFNNYIRIFGHFSFVNSFSLFLNMNLQFESPNSCKKLLLGKLPFTVQKPVTEVFRPFLTKGLTT